MPAHSSPPPAPAALPAHGRDGLSPPRRHLAIGIVLTTVVLVVLDGAIANIALPTIAAALDCQPAQAVWVVSSYQLAVIISLLPCGALGEKLGCRRVFSAGVAVFTAASVACALSVNLSMLVAARFVQGLGAGAIMALYSMILRYSCPQRMLGSIIGINAMTIAISAAAGPGIAGAILSVVGWPWLFAINLPLGALVLACTRLLPGPAGVARWLDLAVIASNTAAVVLFFAGADRIPTAPWWGVPMVLAAIVCLLVVARRERNREAPLVPIDLFRERSFRIAIVGSIACFSGQMLSYVALPFYLQQHLHQDVALSGLYLMPCPLLVAITAPLAGRLSDRVPTGFLCAAGAGILASGLALIGLSPSGAPLTIFLVGTILAGAGFGLFQTPNNRILLLSAPKERSGAAGAMQATARVLGQTIGSISMSVVFKLARFGEAPRTGLLMASGLAATASLVSLWRARFECIPLDGPGPKPWPAASRRA